LQFPLLVTYTSKNIENNESEGITTKDKSSEESNSSKTSGDPAADENTVITKTLSFWTVIGLGSVIKAPTGTSGAMVTGPRSESSGSKGPTSRSSSSGNSARSKS
jgi:hypothetical protein